MLDNFLTKKWGIAVENDGMFKKIKNKSVVQTVVDSITKAIITGDLKPGDKIPTEMELAESFGVGRNSIREAIKILVYYGVLEIRRAEGTFVCDGFNKIKTLRRQGYGYPDDEYFFLKLFDMSRRDYVRNPKSHKFCD